MKAGKKMKAEEALARARMDKRKLLTVDESLSVLRGHGIPTAEYGTAKNLEGVIGLARKIGYPVVLKLVSRKASHKSDVGGVIVDLRSENEVRDAFGKIVGNAKRSKSGFDCVLVQEMVRGGQEVIIGGKKDAQFGQTILFGSGGIYVEAFGDSSVRVVPIGMKDAESMIAGTKMSKILGGLRGKSYDVAAAKGMLLKVSKLLDRRQDIAELDINPVIVLPKGKGAIAVDARVLLE